ncbi:HAD family hydrolase [Streptomyces sp. GESEQ-35]|uniref:HAD-IIIC family phosphatase n=1 Tax=Streptomyces sp. GESEQ-35 TaxID=2812657 RepID=UPI001B344ED8|nr:HAD-IIIC family phosphatase [Streptomyces sp. GESEQ-35]
MTTTAIPEATDAFAAFQKLSTEERLVDELPRALGLVASVSEDELPRAGRLLAGLDDAQVRRAHPELPTVRIAISGHSTLNALIPAVVAQLARHGLWARPKLSDFDSYVFDLSDSSSELYAYDPDLALCLLDAQVVLDKLPNPWTVQDLSDVLDAELRLLEGLVARFGATARGTLVLNTLPLPHALTAQLVDLRSRARAGALWREANARLLRLVDAHPQLVVLDLETVDNAVRERPTAPDTRLSLYAKVHLSPETLGSYAREVGHLARMLTGRLRKCLVLDLDNTVWGGVLGDDGPEGIEVADTYRGEAFRAFQRLARQIASQGVLLAAVSKNDLDPVRDVLRGHPGMTLREEDFVRVVANWRPKHENLRELAADLNIGVDSFVFVDDSPYERGLVRRELPEVSVVDVDEEPALHGERLLQDGWFTVRELTGEDRKRPDRYREELVRRDFLNDFDSIENYLRELGVTVRLSAVEERDVPRISQITLRTNQFNMTGRRLQPEDVRAWCADPERLPLAVHASDRFGDNGIVGAVFLRFEGDSAVLDNLLLSCRVFSRGIEQSCLSAVLRYAKHRGVREVTGAYARTAKNGKVADFYQRAGFVPLEAGQDRATFRHDLGVIADPPEHVALTEHFGDSRQGNEGVN